MSDANYAIVGNKLVYTGAGGGRARAVRRPAAADEGGAASPAKRVAPSSAAPSVASAAADAGAALAAAAESDARDADGDVALAEAIAEVEEQVPVPVLVTVPVQALTVPAEADVESAGAAAQLDAPTGATAQPSAWDLDPSNPVADMIDPITLERVVKPAVSPHGVVMGYDTWIRCLSRAPRNVCPITKQTVTKRDLVRLTWENIEEYRALIKS